MVFKNCIQNAVWNDSGQALSLPDPGQSSQPLCLSSVATQAEPQSSDIGSPLII
jgi:hypothetical protein